jgi:hypothetical protein
VILEWRITTTEGEVLSQRNSGMDLKSIKKVEVKREVDQSELISLRADRTEQGHSQLWHRTAAVSWRNCCRTLQSTSSCLASAT